jgi:transposase
MARRYALRDEQWPKTADVLPGRDETVGVTAKDNRLFVDTMGNPTGFHLTPGQASDLAGAEVLLPAVVAETVIADKASDADKRVLQPLQRAGKTAVMPPKSNRKVQRPYDEELYKARHRIEHFLARLKQYRAMATCYDKRATIFLAVVYMVASILWLN